MLLQVPSMQSQVTKRPFLLPDSIVINIPGDFSLSNSTLTFTGDNVNDTLCGVFQTVHDQIVEDNERFHFPLSTENSLDYFAGDHSVFQLSIDDDDGRL